MGMCFSNSKDPNNTTASKIQIRLRQGSQFRDFSGLMATMLHEITHIKHGHAGDGHDRKFLKLENELRKEYGYPPTASYLKEHAQKPFMKGALKKVMKGARKKVIKSFMKKAKGKGLKGARKGGYMVTLHHSGGQSTVSVYRDPVEDTTRQVVVATLPNGKRVSSIGKAKNFVRVQWSKGKGGVGQKNTRNKTKIVKVSKKPKVIKKAKKGNP